jgi:hypothetical protein
MSMADLWSDVADKLGNLAGKWPSYAALGTFLLYLFGYLALRFQLNTYGVAVNLDAFDEKYLFAGCRFLLFLGMTLPSILLILAVVLLPLYCGYRVTPASLRSRLNSAASRWSSRPHPLQLAGCVLALLLIQMVLRQCVLLSNMLLRDRPPEFWISSVLLAGDFAQTFYFTGLVLGTGLTVALLVYTLGGPAPPGALSRSLTALLVFLVAVEFLLLPVNYGILVSSTWLPRVSQIENQAQLAAGSCAWLVWESKEALTYLVCENNSRTLVSIPRKEDRVTIVGYDPIFQAVGRPPCSLSR